VETPEDEVRRAAALAGAALEPLADRDWDTPARDLDLSARQTLEHVVEGLVFYARDLATPVTEAPGEHELELRCVPGTPVTGLVDGMRQAAAVVAAVVAATPDQVRAFHPFGPADRSGFAAMACDEILIHTYDIVAGFGVGFEPAAELCEHVLRRLFPWAPATGAAWDRLRWANGRIAMPDQPRQERWRWHCAPLEEWDGSVPTG
jgi:hypothetical protein